MDKRHIFHVVPGLNGGGAEKMLLKVVASTGHQCIHTVFSIKKGGRYAASLHRAGATVHDGLSVRSIFRALKCRCDVIQGWMYYGNIAATALYILKFFRGRLLWNIRHSVHDLNVEPPKIKFAVKVGAALSGLPVRVIYNSYVSIAQHEALGYKSSRSVYVGNGFKIQKGDECISSRAERRARSFESFEKVFRLILVARFHPMKNHIDGIRAVIEASRRLSRSWMIELSLFGEGVRDNESTLMGAVGDVPENCSITLNDFSSNIENIIAQHDALFLPSRWGEAFPNVIGEALSVGVPIIATDVGDSRRLVGRAGVIAMASDHTSLAEAILRIVERDIFVESVSMARMQAQTHSIESVSEAYINLWMG